MSLSCCAELPAYASCVFEGWAPFTSQVALTEKYLQSEDVYIKHFYLQLIFEGIRGRSFRGDAAIDDVMIYDC